VADDDSKSASASTWPALVDQINQTFNLVRDVFGYALPGGVFLAVGLISGRFTLVQVQTLLSTYHLPAWAAFFAIVAACYPVGTVMAAAAYMPFMLAKTAVWFLDIISKPPDPPKGVRGSLTKWLTTHPTEVTAEILEIRANHPKLLDTLDRRETLALLAGSLTTALLGGWYVFCCAKWGFGKIIFGAGVITLIQFLTGLGHLRRVAKATYGANEALSKEKKSANNDPDFVHLLGDLIKAATAALKKIG
jgi:hypothetical protein